MTVVAGFLGAGKTTLLNHIANHQPEMRMELIIREYAPVGVDDKLIAKHTVNVSLMAGTCLHGDPEHELFWAMERLYARCDRLGTERYSWQDVDFDYLVLEASGLDSPESLVQIFFQERLRDHYRLDSYVVLVDAEYGQLNLDEYDLVREQVAFADIVLINKVDLVDEVMLSNLQWRIRSINSVAKIYETEYACVDLGRILNAGLFEQVPRLSALAEIAGMAENLRRRQEEGMYGIRSVVLSEKRPLDKAKVNMWIKDLFVNRGSKILRSKGFLDFAGSEHRFVFQAVRKTFHSTADRLWEPEDERGSVIVLIGEGLDDTDDLQRSFSACVDQSFADSPS